ncbi:MAG: ABC transporter ATP-binding protein [Acidimicrobiia bacterium]|nr:ABC transporter ATP-binding protein [Acidimicrobiia bacterium]
MNAEAPIEVHNVSLAYRLSHNRAGTLKEFAVNLVKGQVQYEKLIALKDVSFTVGRGEVFSIIGPNGAGKSTMMKMVARVLPPTSGRVIVRGSVAPMIELGAGFNPELTGYENIVLYGTLLGRDPAVMRERANAIAVWAELTDFLDVPIRSYSSGMLARLGFAVATDVQPEILLVDEVLAVGDESFQRTSKLRMEEMIAQGTSVVFVSHDLATVEQIATRTLWLDKGVTKMIGEPSDVIAAYKASV